MEASSYVHTKEATTANITKPENKLKTAEHNTYTWELEKTTQKRVNLKSCDQVEPKTCIFPTHRQEEEEQNQEGIDAQELCTPVSGDMLWEHKPTLHWVLVISRTGHQG